MLASSDDSWVPVVPLVDGLTLYSIACSAPRLSRTDEDRLVDLVRNGSKRASTYLIFCHLPLLGKFWRKLLQRNLADEGVQCALIGLNTALEKFEPIRGLRFNTYAAWWVRAEMQSLFDRFSTMGDSRKLLGRVLRVAKAFETSLTELEKAKVLKRYNFKTEKDFKKARTSCDFNGIESIDDTLGDESDIYLRDTIAIPSLAEKLDFKADAARLRAALECAMQILSERERYILRSRILVEDEDRLTFRELGDVYGLTCERIRQIEIFALKKLRGHLRLAKPKALADWKGTFSDVSRSQEGPYRIVSGQSKVRRHGS